MPYTSFAFIELEQFTFNIGDGTDGKLQPQSAAFSNLNFFGETAFSGSALGENIAGESS